MQHFFSFPKGTTSQLIHVPIQDTSSTAGLGGLTGLAWNTASLVAYYIRPGDASATVITLATMTLGTWATGGLVKVSDANAPGLIEIGVPNACLASGANLCTIMLKGAANMAPTTITILLTDSVWDELIASHTSASSFGGQMQALYDADIEYQRDDTSGYDRYVVTWRKNGVAVTSGITSPTLTAIDLSAVTTLLSAVSMTDDTGGKLKYTTTSARQTLGIPYRVLVTATIDGSSRTAYKNIGRDS